MKIITNLLKDSNDEWLLNTTVSLNNVNPIVDRIMEDNSIEGVVMTNKEESLASEQSVLMLSDPVNHGHTPYPKNCVCVGNALENWLNQDLFDELLVLRLHTNKHEVMTAHHSEFNVIVLQQPGMMAINK